MQSRVLFGFDELSYCIYSVLRSVVKYSIKRFIILFLINAIINYVSNKIVFEFKSREILTIIVIKKFTTIINVKKKFANNKFIFRKKIVDVIFFVNAKIKIYYNVKYTSFLIKKIYAFLKLNYDY